MSSRDVFAERLPMSSHASGPAIDTKRATSVQTRACSDESELAERDSVSSAITSRTNVHTAVADQTTSHHAGSSRSTDSDVRRA